jgi:hypothetical protein
VTFFLWKDEYNITVGCRCSLKQRRIGTGSFFPGTCPKGQPEKLELHGVKCFSNFHGEVAGGGSRSAALRANQLRSSKRLLRMRIH